MSRLKGSSVIVIIVLGWVLIPLGCGKSDEARKREELVTTKKHLESVVLVEAKCSRCHSMDRIHKALGDKSYKELQEIVERMQIKPDSGINQDDAKKILEAFKDFYMMKTEKR